MRFSSRAFVDSADQVIDVLVDSTPTFSVIYRQFTQQSVVRFWNANKGKMQYFGYKANDGVFSSIDEQRHLLENQKDETIWHHNLAYTY
jgi:hypothetical protein